MRDSYHYPLPRGLAAGTRVKLMDYDHGYWTVEACGELYRVFGPLVDAGFEYELNGRWYPATDPGVMARKKEETLMKSRAYSCVAGECVNPPV